MQHDRIPRYQLQQQFLLVKARVFKDLMSLYQLMNIGASVDKRMSVPVLPQNNVDIPVSCLPPPPPRGVGGGGTFILGHGREVPRWWPPFWGFSIWLGPYFIHILCVLTPGTENLMKYNPLPRMLTPCM